MNLAAFVGFAIVFVLVAWTASAILAVLAVALRRRLRRRGAASERHAAALAIVVPLVLALAVLLALLGGQRTDDHCEGHAHHAHLCLAHAAGWLERPWAVVLAAISTTTITLRLVLVVVSRVRAHRAIAILRKVSSVHDEPAVRLVASPRPFCFIAGLRRPEVYVSSAAWSALDEAQRSAVLAHERAHAQHGDLWRRAALELAGVFAAPLVAARLRSMWTSASERLADARAVAVAGSGAVASALVVLCRAGRVAQPLPGFTPSPDALDDRVRAILTEEPTGEARARRLTIAAVSATATAAVLAIALADPLHHLLETLLG